MNDFRLQQHQELAAARRTLPCVVYTVTYEELPRGGTRRVLTPTYPSELCRIEPPGGSTSQMVGGFQRSVAEFSVHLRPDLVVPNSGVVEAGGDQFEVLGDKSHPSHRSETVLACRRLE